MVIRSWPYRLPEHKKVVQMLEMGVIEEFHSERASPIGKTNGSTQLCVDYRKVNAAWKNRCLSNAVG